MEQAALGFVQVANETMARAIREISVMRGFDIQNHVLACFGGAGHQICGPALIIQDTATVVVEPGCTAEITDTGDISIQLGKQKNTAESFSDNPAQLTAIKTFYANRCCNAAWIQRNLRVFTRADPFFPGYRESRI